jgi:hypothetical protein
MIPLIVGAKVAKNAVSNTANAKGGCVTCGGAVKMTYRGRWQHVAPPKQPHPVRLAK